MFDKPLPQRAEVRKLAAQASHFSARLDVACMPRIAEIVVEQRGVVDVDLNFDLNQQRIPVLSGRAHAAVEVICQRCLAPVAIDVRAEFALGIIWDEKQGQSLDSTLEPLLIEDGALTDLNAVVEDELLLNMPFVSYHAHTDCIDQLHYEHVTPAETAVIETKANPFSVLATLKTKD